METKLRAWCVGIGEAAALMVVACVPLFVNYYSFRIFEPDKQAIVFALATVAALAGLVAAIEGGLAKLRAAARQPLVAAALALCATYVLATATSISPRLSFLGSGERAQGLLALLSVLALFGTVAWVSADAARRARLLAWLIVGSIPVAALAIVQAFGIELVAGEVESRSRVFGTLSNPIFLGAYLMLVVPSTMAQAWNAWRGGRFAQLGGLAAILFVQLVALVLSASRGPLLGLLAGLVVMLLAASVRAEGRRLGGLVLALSAAGLVFLVVFNQPDSPLASLRHLPYVGRLGQIADTSRGSEAARMRIWAASNRLLAASPLERRIVGYGPETLKYALLPHGETYMAGRGQAERLVDRAHNVLLDSLIMTGMLGALALFLVYGAWLFTAARLAGLVKDAGEKRALVFCLALGAVAGAAAWLVPPLRLMAAALVHLGLVAGLVVYLIALWWRHHEERPASDLLAIALLGTGVAAIVEAAFGIQTVVSQVTFWVLGGLLVGLAARYTPSTPIAAGAATGGVTGRAAAEIPAPRRATRREAGVGNLAQRTIELKWSSVGAARGFVLGTALGLVVYGAFLYGTPATADAFPVALTVILLTWLAGLVLAADAEANVASIGLAAILALGLYLLLRWLVLLVAKDAAVLYAVTLWWLVLVTLGAGWLLRSVADRRAPVLQPLAAGAYLVAAVLGVAAVFARAVLPIQGDIYFQSALANFGAALAATDTQTFEKHNQAAEELYRRAVARNPREPLYPMRWGELYTRLGADIMASPGTDAEARAKAVAEAFQRAQTYTAAAEQLEPLLPYHAFNRGHLQLLFAQGLPDGDQRRQVAANAAAAFEAAFEKVNYDPAIVTEYGLARLLEGRTSEAIALLEYARDHLDAASPATLQALAQAYRAAGRPDDALNAAQQALQAGAKGPEVLTVLGDLERDRDRIAQALQYYVQAAELAPSNWGILYNLGLLYRDNGDTERAMDALVRALSLAPESEQERVQAAIDSLLETGQTPPAPAVAP